MVVSLSLPFPSSMLDILLHYLQFHACFFEVAGNNCFDSGSRETARINLSCFLSIYHILSHAAVGLNPGGDKKGECCLLPPHTHTQGPLLLHPIFRLTLCLASFSSPTLHRPNDRSQPWCARLYSSDGSGESSSQ